mgnify:CR=1 FL=1
MADAGSGNLYFDLRGKLYSVPPDDQESLAELQKLGATQLDEREGSVRRFVNEYKDSTVAPFLYGVGKGLTFNVLPSVLQGVGALEEGEAEAIERAAPGTVLAGEVAGAIAPVIGTFGAAAPATGARLGARTLGAAFKEAGELAAKDTGARALARTGVRGAIGAAATPARVVSEQALRAGQKLADAIPGETLISRAARTVTPGATAGAIEGALYSAGAGFNEEMITNPDATMQEALILGAKDMGDGFLWGSVFGGGLSALIAGGAKTFQGASSIAKRAYQGAFEKYGEGFSDRVARMIMTGDDESREAFRRKLYQTLDPADDFDLKAMQSQITQAENVSTAFKDTMSEFRIERRIETLEQQKLRGEKRGLVRDIAEEQAATAARVAEAVEPLQQQIDEAKDFVALYKAEDYEAKARERGLRVLNAEEKAVALDEQNKRLIAANERLAELKAEAAQDAQRGVEGAEQRLAEGEAELAAKRGEIAEARVISNKAIAEVRQIYQTRERLLLNEIQDATDRQQMSAQRPEVAKKFNAQKEEAQEKLRVLRKEHREEMLEFRFNEQAVKEISKENLEYLNNTYRQILSDPSQDKALVNKTKSRLLEAIDETEKSLIGSTDELAARINKKEKDLIALDKAGEREQKRFTDQAKKEFEELRKNTKAAKEAYENALVQTSKEFNNPATNKVGSLSNKNDANTNPVARVTIALLKEDFPSASSVQMLARDFAQSGRDAFEAALKKEFEGIPLDKLLSQEGVEELNKIKRLYNRVFSESDSVSSRLRKLADDFDPDDQKSYVKLYEQYLSATKIAQSMNTAINNFRKTGNEDISSLTNIKDAITNVIYDLDGEGAVLDPFSRLFGDASSFAADVRKLRSFAYSTQRLGPKEVQRSARNTQDVYKAAMEIYTFKKKKIPASAIEIQNLLTKINLYQQAQGLETAFKQAVDDLSALTVRNQRNYEKSISGFDRFFAEPSNNQGFAAARENLREIISQKEVLTGELDQLRRQYQLGTEEALKQATLAEGARVLISKSFESLRRQSDEFAAKLKDVRDGRKKLNDKEATDLVLQRLELQDRHAQEIANAQLALREANVSGGDEANIIAKQLDEMNVGEQDFVAVLKDQLRAEPKSFQNTMLLLRAVRDDRMRNLRLQESQLLAQVKELRASLKDTKAAARKPLNDEIVALEAEIQGIKTERKNIINAYKAGGPSVDRARAAADLEFVQRIAREDESILRGQIDELTDGITSATEEKLSDTFARIKKIDEELFESQQRNLDYSANEAERLKSLSKEVDPDIRRILDYRKRDRFGSIANFFGLELLTNFGGAMLPAGMSAGIFLGSKLIDQPRDVLRITGGLLGLSSKMNEVIDKGAKATVDRVTKPGTVTSISKTGEELRVSPLYNLVGLSQSYTNEPNKPLTQEQYNEASKEIREKATDTAGMERMMKQSVSPFQGIKKLQGPARAAPGRTLNFLNSLVPQQPSMGLFDYTQKVTPPEQRQALKNAMLVVRDPVNTFFDQLQTNTLSPMTVQTMRVIYPDVTNQIIEATLNAFSASGKQIPYTTRLALSSGLSAGLDSSVQPANVQLFQLNFQNQGPGQQQGGQATVNAGALTQMPAAQQTGVNRVSSK